MSCSYKKNNKDKNYTIKLNIKNEIKSFDEKLIFESYEELNKKVDEFLSKIEKNYKKRYLIIYIGEKLKQKEKFLKQLERSKKSKNIDKKNIIKNKLEETNKIIKLLNIKLENISKTFKKENIQNNNKISSEETYYDLKQNEEEILTKLEYGNIKIDESIINPEQFLKTLYFYLRNYDLNENYKKYINDTINFLCNLENENIIEKEDVEKNLYFMIDIIRNRINIIPKENKQLREQFKIIKKKLEMVLEIYKTDIGKIKHDYYYDILETLLESPKNYYVIEKLVDEMKQFVNASQRVRIKKGYNNKCSETYYMKHILITIIDKYTQNYKLELRGQTKDFISKEYYLKLYYLFIKNPYLKIDKKLIYAMLKDFSLSLDKANYLRKEKDKIIEEITCMINEIEKKEEVKVNASALMYINNLSNMIKNNINSNRIRMDKEYLTSIKSDYEMILSNFENPTKEDFKTIQRTLGISNRDKRNILLGCDTISFNKDHSYTISYYDDGSYSFRFNTFDLASLIKDTTIEDYLKNILEKKCDNILLNNEELKIEKGRKIPSITYEIRVYQNGMIGPLKIYKSVTEVTDEYSSIDGYKTDLKLKNIITIYKILTKDNKPNLDSKIIDDYFIKLFSKLIMDLASNNKLPIIVKGKSDIDKDYYMKLHYKLCEIYSKIDRKDFEKIYNIMNENLDIDHFDNNYENGDYNIVFENNYVKYFNQSIITEYITNKEVDKNILNEALEVKEKANKGISYISDQKTIDKNKTKGYYN